MYLYGYGRDMDMVDMEYGVMAVVYEAQGGEDRFPAGSRALLS